MIDFSPVYRCLHIYTVLASRDVFETYYRKQRKKQARLVLQPPTNMVLVNNTVKNIIDHVVMIKVTKFVTTLFYVKLS